MGANLLVFILSVQIILFVFASFTFEEEQRGLCKRVATSRLRCKPRTEIIKLTAKDHNIRFLPSAVEVKRCSDFGICGPRSCIPTEKKFITIEVNESNVFNTQWNKCGIIRIEEHTKCACRCSKTKEDCHKNHKFNPNNCTCKCLGYSAQIEECNQQDKVWDVDTCECKCSDELQMDCPTGFEWNQNLCECVPADLLKFQESLISSMT